MNQQTRILVAGIGGASLGTEILKCLLLVRDQYTIFGCDISPLAFGHYQGGFTKTFLIDRSSYIQQILEICHQMHIECIVPGGEEPLALLSAAIPELDDAGIRLAANSRTVIDMFTNKATTFEVLAGMGFVIPRTVTVSQVEDLKAMIYPCIVKPGTGSGGSSFVFFAENGEEALLYIEHLTRNGKVPVVQEYIPTDEGEYTIGVLSLPGRKIVGSIALRRTFDSKLSVAAKGQSGLISSGYSQGVIADFPDLRAEAERIALAVGSEGPLNIQGRVRDGQFIPFEINPRFSASTYLRAMAGFNEIDLYLQYVKHGVLGIPEKLRPGYYLRSLTEVFVSTDQVKI